MEAVKQKKVSVGDYRHVELHIEDHVAVSVQLEDIFGHFVFRGIVFIEDFEIFGGFLFLD